MKLWQKIFLYTLILVMLAVSMTSILLLKNSFSIAMDQKKQSVYSEHEFLITSFKSMMLTERLKANVIVLDEGTLRGFMAETFGAGNNGVAFLEGDKNVFYVNKEMTIPQELLEAVEKEQGSYMQVQQYQLYTISAESLEGKNYYIITENDISDVVKIHENMLYEIQIISMSLPLSFLWS